MINFVYLTFKFSRTFENTILNVKKTVFLYYTVFQFINIFQMKRLIIFLTVIIIHLICGLDSDLHFQSKYSSKYNNLRT